MIVARDMHVLSQGAEIGPPDVTCPANGMQPDETLQKTTQPEIENNPMEKSER